MIVDNLKITVILGSITLLTACGGSSDSPAPIEPPVEPPVEEVTLNDISLSTSQTEVMYGDTVSTTLSANWSDGSSTDVAFNNITWSSIPADSFSISAGSLQLQSIGDVTLIASYQNKTSQVNVSVMDMVNSFSISGEVTAIVNDSFTFMAEAKYLSDTIEDVTQQTNWLSSNDAIISISADGAATAHSAGSVQITATYQDFSEIVTVTVADPLQSITITNQDTRLDIGDSLQLAVQGQYASGNTIISDDINWSSTNDTIALVTQTGLVSAIKDGMVSITAQYDGKEAQISLEVLPPVITGTHPSIANGTLQLTEGEVLPDHLTIEYSDNSTVSFNWQNNISHVGADSDESNLSILIKSADNADRVRAIRAGDSSFTMSGIEDEFQQILLDLSLIDDLTTTPKLNVTVTDNPEVYQWHLQQPHSIAAQSTLVQSFQSGNNIHQIWHAASTDNIYLTTVGSSADAILISQGQVEHNQQYNGGGNGYYLLTIKNAVNDYSHFRYNLSTGDLNSIDLTGYHSAFFNINFSSYMFDQNGDLFVAYTFNKQLTPYKYTFADKSWTNYETKYGIFTQIPGLTDQIIALDTRSLTSSPLYQEAQIHRFSITSASWEESQVISYGNDDVYCHDKFSFIASNDNSLASMGASCPVLNKSDVTTTAGAYIWQHGLSNTPTYVANTSGSMVYSHAAADWPIIGQFEDSSFFTIFGRTQLSDNSYVIDVYTADGKDEITPLSTRNKQSYSDYFMVKQGDISTIANPNKQQELFSIFDFGIAYHNEQEGWITDLEMFAVPSSISIVTPIFSIDGTIYIVGSNIWTLQLRQ
ncbi:Ig-like domain-containing protein [Shewanella maritima]|uniref:Ig-like domain-containing protein n=1 Tax=Shewanella maritima TaxID=2520507 RepID=UPI0037365A4F